MARRLKLGRWAALALVGAFLVALPLGAPGTEQQGAARSAKLYNFSRVASLRMPEFAPKLLTARMAAVRALAGRAVPAGIAQAGRDVFNNDILGLPQNEESVTACKTNRNVVLSGTNDYRGLIDNNGDFTGWHLSLDGGRSLANEGLLPSLGPALPSGGDPIMVAGQGCALFGGGLAYNPEDPFHNPNGIQVAKSDPATLSGDTCPPAPINDNPACWPTNELVAASAEGHFLDKPWFDVGVSGDAGEVVWITYSDFTVDDAAPLGFTQAEIFAVRCDANVANCTAPIPISVDDGDVQFSDVTIAPDGRVYVTWSEIVGELPTDPEFPVQTFIHKLRIAEPGSTDFGEERIVFPEVNAIPFGGFMHSNDWRVATYPKNDVAMVGGKPRIFVVWDACQFRPLDSICEEAEIKLSWSDNDGVSWSPVRILSRGGDNYFPSIVSNDAARPTLAFTWFSNRRDRAFHNRQDVEFVAMNPASGQTRGFRRITSAMNESEADPVLGGFFIGDYIEVAAVGDRAWVAYNANYLQKQLLGPLGVDGIPVAQQDNYLRRVNLD
jgi:hypothetical protein